MRVSVHETADGLGRALAGEIFAAFQSAQRAGQKYLLGCPSGRSPKSTYAALAALFADADLDLSDLILVMMDEYVEGSHPEFRYVEIGKHYSCRRFASVEMAARFNAGLSRSKHLPPENIWFPDPIRSSARNRSAVATGFGRRCRKLA